MKRHIAYAAIIENEKAKVQIREQSHRRDNFMRTGRFFTSSSGFQLRSINGPEYHPYKRAAIHECFVRGHNTSFDNKAITMPIDIFVKFAQAVQEYNQLGEKEIPEAFDVILNASISFSELDAVFFHDSKKTPREMYQEGTLAIELAKLDGLEVVNECFDSYTHALTLVNQKEK